MSINITKKTGTANTTASAGRKILYIVEHYTAGITSKSGSAASVASWFAQSAAQASADFIVDDATIVQYNPDPANRYCWAVGGSKNNTKGGSLYGVAKNANCISIEICSTNSAGRVTNANDSYWSFTDAVLNKAVELTQYLMGLYGIDADHVIRHYDVNGKLCPGIVGWNADSGSEAKWTAFKARLGSSGSSGSTTTSTASSTAASSGSTTHTVVAGDTLSALAAKYGTTVDAIVSANKSKYSSITASYIEAGWVLDIPAAGSSSATKTATDAAQGKDASLAGTYTVTASSLNIRTGAGTGKDILAAVPKGTKAQCYGYYTAVSGVRWLYVQVTYGGVTYVGFASSAYLAKQ